MPEDASLRNSLSRLLLRGWRTRGILAVLLLPLSLVYVALTTLHRWLYRRGLLASRCVDCTVLVVGNAIVGGAGKTPTTIGIVQHLRQRGLQVGVVSRGHGRRGKDVRCVTATDDAEDVGDEPLLIARTTGVAVFVAPRRWDAAAALLAAQPQTQVIVCDDGLQHYALHRDLEICVFDDRGIGNGWLLPSGPLREPWPRKPIARVGQSDERLLLLHTGSRPAFAGFRAQRQLADHAVDRYAQRVELRTLQHPVLALAGIAQPDAFFAALRAQGLALEKTLALPDHFDFARLDLGILQGYQVLCTEKDAAKLWKRCPTALAVPLIQTLEPAFLRALDPLLDASLAAKLSYRDGH